MCPIPQSIIYSACMLKWNVSHTMIQNECEDVMMCVDINLTFAFLDHFWCRQQILRFVPVLDFKLQPLCPCLWFRDLV